MGFLNSANWVQGGIGGAQGNLNNAWAGMLGSLQGQPGQKGLWGNISDQAGPGQGNAAFNLNSLLSGAMPGLLNYPTQVPGMFNPTLSNIGNFTQGLTGLESAFGQPMSSGMQQANSAMPYAAQYQSNLAGGQAPMTSLAGQVFAGGGWTPQYQQGFGDLSSFLGQQTPGVGSSAGTANTLVGNQGANPFNQALQNYALQAASSGGMTPTLQALQNPVAGIMGNQGFNPYTGGIAQQGLNLFNQQALMNPAQAAGLARNQAATNYAQQEQQAEAQALARGGGAGATVANGMQNQGMADFANQAAQGTAGAVNTALQNQQQLQLQQQLGGASAANNAAGTASGLFQGGMGMLPTAQNAATNYLNAYLGGGLGAGQNQIGMLGQGAGLAQMLESGQLGGINAMTGMMGAENQYALGAGQLENQMANTEAGMGMNAGNLYNQMFNQGIQSGQLGATQFNNLANASLGGYGLMNQGNNNMANALAAAYGLQNSGIGAMSNAYSNFVNPLMGIGNNMTNIANAGLGGQAQLWGGATGVAGQLNSGSGLLGLAGSLLGAFGV